MNYIIKYISKDDATVECPFCLHQVKVGAHVCIACNATVKKNGINKFLFSAISIAVFFVLFLLSRFLPANFLGMGVFTGFIALLILTFISSHVVLGLMPKRQGIKLEFIKYLQK